jgi:hypothetical protein
MSKPGCSRQDAVPGPAVVSHRLLLLKIPLVLAAVAGVEFNLHWLKITEMTRASSAVKIETVGAGNGRRILKGISTARLLGF